MSWFSGKDDTRYEALSRVGERAHRDGDKAKGDRMHDKAHELARDGDVSQAKQHLWR